MTIELNPEQQALADKIMQGQSLAIIAEGGTGKSEILKQTLPRLKGVMVVAPTGAAALQVGMGATTIHRAFGLKAVIQDPTKFKNKIQKPVLNVLKRIKVLVVDEIGAVRMDLFESMDAKLRQVKECDLPFGGVQCIFVGDVLQAAPVLPLTEYHHYKRMWNGVWFFESNLMRDIPAYTLTRSERNTDERQMRILQSIRNKDKYADLALKRLWDEAEPYSADSGKIVLCQFNKQSDAVNQAAFEANKNKEYTYYAIDDGSPADLKTLGVPEVVKLKDGLRVMLTTNDVEGDYVNGDTGTILSCEEGCVRVSLDRNGAEVVVAPYAYQAIKYKARGLGVTAAVVGERIQLPIKLGYAISIYKAQGATLESATIDMGNLPEQYTMPAMLYVAISRVRDLRKLSFVRPPRMSDVKVDYAALNYYNRILKIVGV